MEIQSFKKKKNNKYEITFKDNNSIELYDDVIIKYNLLVNKKMNEDKLKEITKYNASLDAYYLSLKYLNSKMRTKLEIKKYLEKKEFDYKIIKETIDKLENNKAIDEGSYIKAFVNDQINFSNIGPKKIVDKLYTLGISKEESIGYIETINKDIWLNKIEKIISQKIKANKNYSVLMLKNKIMTSLINDGYPKELIIQVVDNIEFKNNDDVVLKEYQKLKNKLSKKYDGEALEFQIKMKLKTRGFTNEDLEKIKTGN